MKQPIRLAIIRQKYRFDGGAERFILNMNKLFNNNIIEFHLITRKWPTTLQSNFHIHICDPYKWNRVSREYGFSIAARKYWQYHDCFDLIQSHERIAGCDIFRAGDGVHQVWLEQLIRTLSPIQRWLYSYDRYHCYVLAAEKEMFNSPLLKKIICNSAMVRKNIIRCYNVAKEKIKVIYNAVDLEYFKPANDKQQKESRAALSIPNNVCTLIYVGSGFRRKGLYQAIKAIANTNHYLIIVGHDKHIHHYKSFAQSIGCLSRLRFMGIRKNVLFYYHAADAFILPTLYDPFPNSILEAMSCGLPIITSSHCGGAEFIVEGKHGFVCDALDINNLKEIISVIPLKEQYPTMGLAARKRVSNCTFDNFSRQLLSFYQSFFYI